MDHLSDKEIFEARVFALVNREDICHALGCDRCGLREEALFDLALLGWTEEAFIVEAYDWAPDA